MPIDDTPNPPTRIEISSGQERMGHWGRAGHFGEMCYTTIDPKLTDQPCSCGFFLYLRKQL
ncbi:MAG: hypothetical protein ACHQ7N_08360 [Candidatus Methylomirabilales bacterium]